ncbi:MAG TPA: hypothetical protein VHN98_13075 [Acidimicrobiales bacterium]|nr:hypothetical protein [Acidimicrobiales bacterium]
MASDVIARRRPRALVLLAAFALGSLLAVTGNRPAQALDGGEYVIPVQEGAHVVENFAAMPASDPSGSFTTDPDSCVDLPFCTTIQLKPRFPSDWNPDTDWLMYVNLTWQRQSFADLPQNAVTGGNGQLATNDVDIYVYTKETKVASDGSTSEEYREVGRSASAGFPEQMKLYGSSPDNPIYYVVVYNSSGVNLGFTLDTTVRVFSFADPDSYLTGGAFGGGSSSGGSGSGSSLFGTSPSSGFPSAPLSPASFGPGRVTPRTPSDLPMLTPGAVASAGAADAALSSFLADLPVATKGLEADLAGAPSSGILDAVRNRHTGPPRPVHAPVLVFWLALVPLALLAAAVGFLIRRRPAALTFPAPAPAPAPSVA